MFAIIFLSPLGIRSMLLRAFGTSSRRKPSMTVPFFVLRLLIKKYLLTMIRMSVTHVFLSSRILFRSTTSSATFKCSSRHFSVASITAVKYVSFFGALDRGGLFIGTFMGASIIGLTNCLAMVETIMSAFSALFKKAGKSVSYEISSMILHASRKASYCLRVNLSFTIFFDCEPLSSISLLQRRRAFMSLVSDCISKFVHNMNSCTPSNQLLNRIFKNITYVTWNCLCITGVTTATPCMDIV